MAKNSGRKLTGSDERLPTAETQEAARIAVSQVAEIYLRKPKSPLTVKIEVEGVEKILNIPAPAFDMIYQLLKHMALGQAVSIIPDHTTLTTQEAADYLNVSRPYLIGLLEKGELPFTMTGTHRRIKFSDLTVYEKKIKMNYEAGMKELVTLTKEMELY